MNHQLIAVVDIISRIALVGFSLLLGRNYYDKKGPVCYILTIISPYSCGELSTLFFYILLQDTSADIHLLLLYFDAIKISYFYDVLFEIITVFLFFSQTSEYVPLWYFQKQFFAPDKSIHNLPILDYLKHSATTEIWSTIWDQLIMVNEIMTQISNTWHQLIFGKTLHDSVSVRYWPGTERQTFCVLIVDIISRRTLLGFSLLRARNYYNKNGPVCYIWTLYSHYWYGE